MRFDWSEIKNEANIRKHHLDFSDAWPIFESPMLVAVDDREDYGEPRFIGVGFLGAVVAVVVFSELENDTIRIISLRRAVKYEREKFFNYLQNELGSAEDDVG